MLLIAAATKLPFILIFFITTALPVFALLGCCFGKVKALDFIFYYSLFTQYPNTFSEVSQCHTSKEDCRTCSGQERRRQEEERANQRCVSQQDNEQSVSYQRTSSIIKASLTPISFPGLASDPMIRTWTQLDSS